MAVLAIVLAVVLSFGWTTSTPEPAVAQGQGCILDISGTIGLVICGGEIIDRLPLPTITIKGPTITLPPLPPVTIRPPRVTETVTVPGPTTVVTQAPGGTETVYVVETVVGPTSNVTVSTTETTTARPSDGPTQTVTEQTETTVTASPTRQPEPDDGKVEPEPPAVDLGDGKTTIVEAGLGVLSLLALVGLILLGLYAGYVLGYKDRENKDTKFMRALLEQASLRRGKHS